MNKLEEDKWYWLYYIYKGREYKTYMQYMFHRHELYYFRDNGIWLKVISGTVITNGCIIDAVIK